MIRVKCTMTDCLRFNKPADTAQGSDACDCSHPEKDMHVGQYPCPLYKTEWSTLDSTNLAERFKNRGRMVR